MNLFPEWANQDKVVIGLLHLRALPGSPQFEGNLASIRDWMLRDAEALLEGGVDGMILENFGDVPFFPGRVPAEVVAHMTALACEVTRRFDRPLGINVLRNDGQSALAVAHASGAKFIRVNVLCGARVTDQGIVQGIAHDLLRQRASLRAEQIRILADVDVKHSAPLAPRKLEHETQDTIERGLADALIVSGPGTGCPADPGQLLEVKLVAGNRPIFIGSGVSTETIGSLLHDADGFIVGTAIKRGGVASNPVDPLRVRALMERIRNRPANPMAEDSR